jgi:hypothetical protein
LPEEEYGSDEDGVIDGLSGPVKDSHTVTSVLGNSDITPDSQTLAAVADHPIYDADGHSIPFGELFHPDTATHQRQLIIFVRCSL